MCTDVAIARGKNIYFQSKAKKKEEGNLKLREQCRFFRFTIMNPIIFVPEVYVCIPSFFF